MSGPYQRILLAYDGSPTAEEALERTIEMAKSWSSQLSIVLVHQQPVLWVVGPAPPDVWPIDEENALSQLLQDAVKKAQKAGVRDVGGILLQGIPADEILRHAEEIGADLIVMGSRGLSSASRLLMGSVSDAVVHHATIAVHVVRLKLERKAGPEEP
ncbi:MAG: universal stress protein [Nitrososphaerota archaeon]|jgi:nucleotide-binding universal stress UspA family protein|nr:universal stress protein [Nitrososphaerota archaeon]